LYQNENVNSNSAPTLDASNSNSGNTFTNSNIISPTSFNQLSEEQQKNEILNNYLPDLSNYQQISFKVKNEKNEDKEFILLPDVNFEENKKGYYIFYNNNLENLKDFFTAELERLKKKHNVVLYHISGFLNKLDEKYDEDKYYEPGRLISRLFSYSYQTIVDEARSIAKNLIKINKIHKFIGKDFKSRICEIVIKDDKELIFNEFTFNVTDFYTSSNNDMKNLSERIKHLGNQYYFNEKESLYFEAESKFRELEDKYKEKTIYISELEKLLDIYLQEIGENVTEIEKIKFLSFILNRASFYLAHPSEQLLANNNLEVLKQLDRLRRKINNLLLTYRYKFEQNKRPILDIPISRYKSLIDTFGTTSIYIQPAEVRKFIEDLEDSLERKANNLKKEKNFEPLSMEQIREIVQMRDGNLSSNEQIKEAMQEKIDDLEDKISSNTSEMAKIAAEVGVNIIKKGAELALGIPSLEEKKNDSPNENQKKAMERINELNDENKKLNKQLNNFKNKLEKIKINLDYDEEFINILKLYSQLLKRNYQWRIDYSGIILSEKRKFIKKINNNVETIEEEVKLREYEIKEISKDKKDN
jgi:hypothetical protein